MKCLREKFGGTQSVSARLKNYLSDRISRNLQYKLDRPFTKVPDGEISLILKNLLSICFGMNYLGFIEFLTRSESGLGLGTVSEI